MDSIEPIESADLSVQRDPWAALSRYTAARIALGRAGGSARTHTQLDFRLAHARARDAVQAPFEADELAGILRVQGLECETLQSAAPNRSTYLRRPDLGRRLDQVSLQTLQHSAAAWGSRDLAIILSDGLSAGAANRHAAGVVVPLTAELRAAGWTVYPLLIVPLARVKLQDEIGELLGARQTIILLGERPGLCATDSLSAYFTYEPRASRTDADRNCISNIRTDGLPPEAAAHALALALIESVRQKRSGVGLRLNAPDTV